MNFFSKQKYFLPNTTNRIRSEKLLSLYKSIDDKSIKSKNDPTIRTLCSDVLKLILSNLEEQDLRRINSTNSFFYKCYQELHQEEFLKCRNFFLNSLKIEGFGTNMKQLLMNHSFFNCMAVSCMLFHLGLALYMNYPEPEAESTPRSREAIRKLNYYLFSATFICLSPYLFLTMMDVIDFGVYKAVRSDLVRNLLNEQNFPGPDENTPLLTFSDNQ